MRCKRTSQRKHSARSQSATPTKSWSRRIVSALLELGTLLSQQQRSPDQTPCNWTQTRDNIALNGKEAERCNGDCTDMMGGCVQETTILQHASATEMHSDPQTVSTRYPKGCAATNPVLCWCNARRFLSKLEETPPLNKNSCDKQVSSWRHISCHTDKNRYYT